MDKKVASLEEFQNTNILSFFSALLFFDSGFNGGIWGFGVVFFGNQVNK